MHWGVRPKCNGNGILAGQCDSGQPRLERGPPSRLNHLLKKAFKFVLLVAELCRATALWYCLTDPREGPGQFGKFLCERLAP